MMNDPAGVTPELRAQLETHYSTNQIVELCLDIMKWSYQKVAVALGVDREIVEGEFTDLSFDAQGNWVRPSA